MMFFIRVYSKIVLGVKKAGFYFQSRHARNLIAPAIKVRTERRVGVKDDFWAIRNYLE